MSGKEEYSYALLKLIRSICLLEVLFVRKGMKMYDPAVQYTPDNFRTLSSEDLHELFQEARKVVLEVQGIALIRKVTNDIARMRLIMNGFDSIHNRSTNAG